MTLICPFCFQPLTDQSLVWVCTTPESICTHSFKAIQFKDNIEAFLNYQCPSCSQKYLGYDPFGLHENCPVSNPLWVDGKNELISGNIGHSQFNTLRNLHARMELSRRENWFPMSILGACQTAIDRKKGARISVLGAPGSGKSWLAALALSPCRWAENGMTWGLSGTPLFIHEPSSSITHPPGSELVSWLKFAADLMQPAMFLGPPHTSSSTDLAIRAARLQMRVSRPPSYPRHGAISDAISDRMPNADDREIREWHPVLFYETGEISLNNRANDNVLQRIADNCDVITVVIDASDLKCEKPPRKTKNSLPLAAHLIKALLDYRMAIVNAMTPPHVIMVVTKSDLLFKSKALNVLREENDSSARNRLLGIFDDMGLARSAGLSTMIANGAIDEIFFTWVDMHGDGPKDVCDPIGVNIGRYMNKCLEKTISGFGEDSA